MNKLSLLPTFTEDERQHWKDWLTAVLGTPELATTEIDPPLYGQSLTVYTNGRSTAVATHDHWQTSGNTIYVGRRSTGHPMPMIDRLAVIGILISAVDLWADLHEPYMARMARELITTYEGLMYGMVQTEGALGGLAFNAEAGQVAGKFGDTFHLPNGEPVEVDDDNWTVVLDRPHLAPVRA